MTKNPWKLEPVAVAAAVRCVLYAVAAFGVGISADQIVAVAVAAEAVSGLFVRREVWPAIKVDVPSGD